MATAFCWILHKFCSLSRCLLRCVPMRTFTQLLYGLDCALFNCWRRVYGEPDEMDVIIFNEMPDKCKLTHSEPDCPKQYCEICRVERMVGYINQARVSIDIAHLTFSHTALFSAIACAQERGVLIRLVTDSQMIFARGSMVQHLVAGGTLVRCSPLHVMMHHKFCIIDGQQRVLQLDAAERRVHSRLWRCRGYLMTGSLNWTKLGTFNNFENVVVTSNRGINELYQEIFEDMWSCFPILNMTSFKVDFRPENTETDPICLPWKFWH